MLSAAGAYIPLCYWDWTGLPRQMQARLSTLQEAKNNTEQQMREVREEIEAEKGMRVESVSRRQTLDLQYLHILTGILILPIHFVSPNGQLPFSNFSKRKKA